MYDLDKPSRKKREATPRIELGTPGLQDQCTATVLSGRRHNVRKSLRVALCLELEVALMVCCWPLGAMEAHQTSDLRVAGSSPAGVAFSLAAPFPQRKGKGGKCRKDLSGTLSCRSSKRSPGGESTLHHQDLKLGFFSFKRLYS